MQELIRQFGVDWRLLIAQAVNFSALLFLLAKFVYRPILDMLKKRREDIERGVRYTKEAKESLARIAVMTEQKLAGARAEALAIVTEAEETAKIRKEEIAIEAVKKSEQIVAEARRLIGQEKAKMNEAVYADAEDLVRSGIARVLGRMPAKERDEALIREALAELRSAHASP